MLICTVMSTVDVDLLLKVPLREMVYVDDLVLMTDIAGGLWNNSDGFTHHFLLYFCWASDMSLFC